MIKNLLIFIVLFVLLLIIINIGLKKHEQSECLQWQAQAKKYPNFYLTDWQKEQCKNYIKVVNKR